MSDRTATAANDPGSGAELHVAPSINAFSSDAWAKLSGTSRENSEIPYNPFLSLGFLSSLEDSGTVGVRTGWQPQHLRLQDGSGRLIGVVPCYLKSHSQGEYVFDHGWADAFERAGGRYYPKLQCAIPFTPATGPRLLVSRNADPTAEASRLAEALATIDWGVYAVEPDAGRTADVT